MPRIYDFRSNPPFASKSLDSSGKHIGKHVYWKLYAIENAFRVIVHSVLSAQIPVLDWWLTAVNQNIREKATGYKNRYLARPWHTAQGIHGIYYIDLLDLTEILRANRNLFSDVMPDIDQWILKIESVNLPRNIVAHMNFPDQNDRERIGVLYNDVVALTNLMQDIPNLAFMIP